MSRNRKDSVARRIVRLQVHQYSLDLTVLFKVRREYQAMISIKLKALWAHKLWYSDISCRIIAICIFTYCWMVQSSIHEHCPVLFYWTVIHCLCNKLDPSMYFPSLSVSFAWILNIMKGTTLELHSKYCNLSIWAKIIPVCLVYHEVF